MSDAIPNKWTERIQFRQWEGELAAAALGDAEKRQWKRSIVRFLWHCKTEQRVVSVAEAKRFLEEEVARRPAAAQVAEEVRRALRWAKGVAS